MVMARSALHSSAHKSSRLLKTGLIMAATSILISCASSTALVVGREKYVLYDKLAVSGASGQTSAYFYRPENVIRQFVVVVQTDPCETTYNEENATNRIGTGGVLWQGFRDDSAFLMLEKPYLLREDVGKVETGRPVGSATRECSMQQWQITMNEIVTAVRREEKLLDTPTIYVGLGDGAAIATFLAERDTRSAGLVLIGASGLGKRFDLLLLALRNSEVTKDAGIATVHDASNIIDEIHNSGDDHETTQPLWGRPLPQWRPFLDAALLRALERQPRLPLLIVHGTADRRFPVESALGLYSELTGVRPAVSLLLLDGLGHDLGVSDNKGDCFAVASTQIAQWSRQQKIATGSVTMIGSDQCPES